MKKRFAVVVDGYSAGNLLAPEIRSRGASVIHVQSTKEIWPILRPSFRPEDYDLNLPFEGNLETLVDRLGQYPVSFVLAGTETGVELADRLAEALRLTTANGTALSEARRNKYLMVEAVRSHGLRAAKQLASSEPEEILSWKHAEGLSAIIVKPPKSAGTDNVALCRTEAEVRAAVNAIVGKTNMLGLDNPVALAQEYLAGTEYFLDTVSESGNHFFTDIWRYKKRAINGRDCVYDCNELCPSDGEREKAMQQYVAGVLDALGIKNGPAHTEVMWTDEGPVLIESGARLDGLSVPSVNHTAIGYSPLDLTIDRYLDVEAFALKTARPYPRLKHALTVYLTSYETGVVESVPGEATLRALPSFFQMRLRAQPGTLIKKTTDYFTAPGFLTLVHGDRNQVQTDYETIRGLERQGKLFQVKP